MFIAKTKFYPADPVKESTLEALVDLILDIFEPEEIWMFGSQASGHWSSESDIDLLVVGKKMSSPVSGELYLRAHLAEIREAFDAVFVSVQDFEDQRQSEDSLLGKIWREGRMLYSRPLLENAAPSTPDSKG